MIPYLQDTDLTIYNGDAASVLRELPDESVHMCVTSPPFFGLRDYGVDGQIGLEATPEEWVASLVSVFEEVRRVLRSDGTLWVECGDSYTSGGRDNYGPSKPDKNIVLHNAKRPPQPPGLKPKDLIGTPWLLAFALRANGWWLRQANVWWHTNCLPESAQDRPTSAHSYVFEFARSGSPLFWTHAVYGTATRPKPAPDYWWFPPPEAASTEPLQHEVKGWTKRNAWRGHDYFYDQVAVQEPAAWDRWGSQTPRKTADKTARGAGFVKDRSRQELLEMAGTRNLRSVWPIPTKGYPDAHFATMPERVVEPPIMAGTSERGVCPECGAPWVREVSSSYDAEGRTTNGPRSVENREQTPGFAQRLVKATSTVGWHPSCECEGSDADDRLRSVQVAPAVVLDPFLGSGTTALVARRLNRRCIGIDLNPDYCKLAAKRTQQLSLEASA